MEIAEPVFAFASIGSGIDLRENVICSIRCREKSRTATEKDGLPKMSSARSYRPYKGNIHNGNLLLESIRPYFAWIRVRSFKGCLDELGSDSSQRCSGRN